MSNTKDDELILLELLEGFSDDLVDLDLDSTPALDSDDALVGTTLINRYNILSVVGVGGWSTVYKAFDKNLDRLAAIKLMHQHLCLDQSKLMRFQREAESSSHLNHPNLAVLYDYGEMLRDVHSLAWSLSREFRCRLCLKRSSF